MSHSYPEPPSARDLPSGPLFPVWSNLGLTTQFLVLTTILVMALTYVSGQVQRSIAMRSIVEGSLEIEQALARVTLASLIGDTPLTADTDPRFLRLLRMKIADQFHGQYFDKVKVWGIDGTLLVDSLKERVEQGWQEPAVDRALRGETVISVADIEAPENVDEEQFGKTVYEVYMPIRASDGRILAVGEIYCSVDLLIARQEMSLSEIDRARVLVGALGILFIGMLVYFAHRRLNIQSTALANSLAYSEEMIVKNARLFEESETLRRQAAESTESLLNHIGAELHDGPIQLLSLAALYRGQAAANMNVEVNTEKSEQLISQALGELRNISSGLVLPELEGLSLQEAVKRSVQSFMTETGLTVLTHIDPTPVKITGPKRVVAYRIVYEALNNARKHAGGKGLQVSLAVLERHAEICITDRGPGFRGKQDNDSKRRELGVQYMTQRAKSVSSSLTIGPAQADGTGTCVALSLPLQDLSRVSDVQRPRQ